MFSVRWIRLDAYYSQVLEAPCSCSSNLDCGFHWTWRWGHLPDGLQTPQHVVARPHFNLCQLAAGQDSWDISTHDGNTGRSKLPIWVAGLRGRTIRCAFTAWRYHLQETPIYVCPGDGKEGAECRGPDQFYCTTQGCETTGDTYWNPSSSWDLITVKRNYMTGGPYPGNQGYWDTPCANATCNPIIIRFHSESQRKNRMAKGKNLGTRVVQIGRR